MSTPRRLALQRPLLRRVAVRRIRPRQHSLSVVQSPLAVVGLAVFAIALSGDGAAVPLKIWACLGALALRITPAKMWSPVARIWDHRRSERHREQRQWFLREHHEASEADHVRHVREWLKASDQR